MFFFKRKPKPAPDRNPLELYRIEPAIDEYGGIGWALMQGYFLPMVYSTGTWKFQQIAFNADRVVIEKALLHLWPASEARPAPPYPWPPQTDEPVRKP